MRNPLKTQAKQYAADHGITYQQALFVVTEPAMRLIPKRENYYHWSVTESKEEVLNALRSSNWLREQSIEIMQSAKIVHQSMEERGQEMRKSGIRSIMEARRLQRESGIKETSYILAVLDAPDHDDAIQMARIGRAFGVITIYCGLEGFQEPIEEGLAHRRFSEPVDYNFEQGTLSEIISAITD